VWGSGDIAPPFFTSAVDGNKRSASLTGRFALKETSPDTHWIGGWVGLSSSLDAAE
jgi:hypothetical protein